MVLAIVGQVAKSLAQISCLTPFYRTLRRWPALSRYAATGHLPIDNNPAENVIRPIALGKKNWLFTGSERAGRRAAVIQTLLGTAKLNGLDPATWLQDTLEKRKPLSDPLRRLTSFQS